jgi:hypothetical protein
MLRRITLPLALGALAGCGDPVLPSDYEGPPTAAVTGNVTGLGQDAERPRMSLEWLLVGAGTASLTGQPLSFQRTNIGATHDWDIGLWLPVERAKFDVPADVGAGAGARIGVGKIVYFDDRNRIDRIDWSCRGPSCNRVLAVSAQFVLYVEQPSYCQEAGKNALRPRIGAGYHYFSFDAAAMSLRELTPTDPVTFTIVDKSPADSMPTGELMDFKMQLSRMWRLGPFGGCD